MTVTVDEGRAGLKQLVSVLVRWFHEPDIQVIRIILGAMMAYYLRSPVWLFVVGPPGTGKTTMNFMASSDLREVVSIGDVTPSTFLSGFSDKVQTGLLEQLGTPRSDGHSVITEADGLLMAKDFTTVITKRRETRALIFAQLREMHDGEFKRSFGTGQSKIWKGRIGFIAAVTPVIDRHYSAFTVLGERFVHVRLKRPEGIDVGVKAIDQMGQESQIREEMSDAISQLFTNVPETYPQLTEEQKLRLASMAEITAVCRTHVYRDSYGQRHIEYVPEPESNTRLSKSFASLACGIAAVEQREQVSEQDMQDVLRVSLDCLPDARRIVLLGAIAGRMKEELRLPRSTRDRTVEELQELGVIDDGLSLQLTQWAEELIAQAGLQTGGRR